MEIPLSYIQKFLIELFQCAKRPEDIKNIAVNKEDTITALTEVTALWETRQLKK